MRMLTILGVVSCGAAFLGFFFPAYSQEIQIQANQKNLKIQQTEMEFQTKQRIEKIILDDAPVKTTTSSGNVSATGNAELRLYIPVDRLPVRISVIDVQPEKTQLTEYGGADAMVIMKFIPAGQKMVVMESRDNQSQNILRQVIGPLVFVGGKNYELDLAHENRLKNYEISIDLNWPMAQMSLFRIISKERRYLISAQPIHQSGSQVLGQLAPGVYELEFTYENEQRNIDYRRTYRLDTAKNLAHIKLSGFGDDQVQLDVQKKRLLWKEVPGADYYLVVLYGAGEGELYQKVYVTDRAGLDVDPVVFQSRSFRIVSVFDAQSLISTGILNLKQSDLGRNALIHEMNL